MNITYEDIIECQNCLVDNWGEAGKAIIAQCFQERKFTNSFTAFLEFCTACGGNWGAMLLSGVEYLYPEVYALVPQNMGPKAWVCICNLLILLGVDTVN